MKEFEEFDNEEEFEDYLNNSQEDDFHIRGSNKVGIALVGIISVIIVLAVSYFNAKSRFVNDVTPEQLVDKGNVDFQQMDDSVIKGLDDLSKYLHNYKINKDIARYLVTKNTLESYEKYFDHNRETTSQELQGLEQATGVSSTKAAGATNLFNFLDEPFILALNDNLWNASGNTNDFFHNTRWQPYKFGKEIGVYFSNGVTEVSSNFMHGEVQKHFQELCNYAKLEPSNIIGKWIYQSGCVYNIDLASSTFCIGLQGDICNTSWFYNIPKVFTEAEIDSSTKNFEKVYWITREGDNETISHPISNAKYEDTFKKYTDPTTQWSNFMTSGFNNFSKYFVFILSDPSDASLNRIMDNYWLVANFRTVLAGSLGQDLTWSLEESKGPEIRRVLEKETWSKADIDILMEGIIPADFTYLQDDVISTMTEEQRLFSGFMRMINVGNADSRGSGAAVGASELKTMVEKVKTYTDQDYIDYINKMAPSILAKMYNADPVMTDAVMPIFKKIVSNCTEVERNGTMTYCSIPGDPSTPGGGVWWTHNLTGIRDCADTMEMKRANDGTVIIDGINVQSANLRPMQKAILALLMMAQEQQDASGSDEPTGLYAKVDTHGWDHACVLVNYTYVYNKETDLWSGYIGQGKSPMSKYPAKGYSHTIQQIYKTYSKE